jgi:hypothetical protein
LRIPRRARRESRRTMGAAAVRHVVRARTRRRVKQGGSQECPRRHSTRHRSCCTFVQPGSAGRLPMRNAPKEGLFQFSIGLTMIGVGHIDLNGSRPNFRDGAASGPSCHTPLCYLPRGVHRGLGLGSVWNRAGLIMYRVCSAVRSDGSQSRQIDVTKTWAFPHWHRAQARWPVNLNGGPVFSGSALYTPGP